MKWWSASKNEYVNLRDMHDNRLLNSYRKLLSGKYRDKDGEKLDAVSYGLMRDAFTAEMASREILPKQ